MAPRPPDDALARLARWDELRRRVSDGHPTAAPLPVKPVKPVKPAAPVPPPAPVIDDVIRTLRDLVDRHPALSLAIVASQDAGAVWHLRVTHTGSGVQVTLDNDDRPEPPAPSASTAARLAELLREHPTILDEPG